MIKTIMITGANSGLGKDAARQFALQDGVEKIYLAYRNEQSAQDAKSELEKLTGRKIFEIILVDVPNLNSARTAVLNLAEPIDALVMNAWGMGGGKKLSDLNQDGVTQMFAVNVLDHVVLLEELLKAKKLTQVALCAGSEAARGIPKMGIKRPVLANSTVEDFVSVIDGSLFGKVLDPMKPYAYTKYPGVRLITVSPGSTDGTVVMNDLPEIMKFMFNKIGKRIMPMFGLLHKLEFGAKRYVDGINDAQFEGGHFYASEKPILTGSIVDHGTIFTDIDNQKIQDNAFQAIHQFIKEE